MGNKTEYVKIRKSLLLLGLFTMVWTLYAADQTLDQWFAEPTHAAYFDIHSELISIFAIAHEHDIPAALLILKLNEGASKKVQTLKMLEAVKAESERLISAKKILTAAIAAKKLAFTPEQSEILLRGMSVFLSGGLTPEQINHFLLRTGESGIDKFLSLGNTLIGIISINELTGESLLKLGDALLESSLNISSYSAVASLFLKGKLQRMNGGDLALMIIGILENDGGLIQMEAELNRRSRR